MSIVRGQLVNELPVLGLRMLLELVVAKPV